MASPSAGADTFSAAVAAVVIGNAGKLVEGALGGVATIAGFLELTAGFGFRNAGFGSNVGFFVNLGLDASSGFFPGNGGFFAASGSFWNVSSVFKTVGFDRAAAAGVE